MNRQIYAFMDTIDKRKIDVTEHYIKKINPKITINKFDHVDENNIKEILKNADVVVNGLDELRALLTIFRNARNQNIPVLDGIALPYANFLVFTSNSLC